MLENIFQTVLVPKVLGDIEYADPAIVYLVKTKQDYDMTADGSSVLHTWF